MPLASFSHMHALCHLKLPNTTANRNKHLSGMEKSNELILLQVLLLGWCLTC